MFCGKCGTQNEDDAVFCVGCGARLDGGQEAVSAGNPGGVHTAAKLDHKKIGIAAVAIVALLAIFLVVGLVGRKPYEKTAICFLKASTEGDAKTILKLLPSKMVDSLEDQFGSREDMIEMFEELAEDSMLDEDVKVSFKCLDSEDMDSDDLEDIQEDYKDYLDIKVSDAKQVKVKITVKEDGETESDTVDIDVIKVGGSWYIDAESLLRY